MQEIPSDSLTIRAACPEDADQAVPLIYCSGPAAFDYVFSCGPSRSAEAFLHFAFGQTAGEFSYRSHVVVLSGQQVVGVGAGFDGHDHLRFTLAALRQILRFYGPAAAPGVIVRGLRTEGIIRPPGKTDYCLCHLGVDPSRRGQGIGVRLVAHLLAVGRSMQHQNAVLDVATTNPRAQSLYERLGFRVTERRPSALRNRHGAVSDHHRMCLALGTAALPS